MAHHLLSLEVPTVMNTCIMSVLDTSIYSPLMPVSCPTLNVTVPGFNYSTQLTTVQGANTILTACDLQLQTQGCDGTTFSDLPDGIYVIKYSVSPNDTVFVIYNHLRITKALNIYNNILCKLDLAACEPPASIQKKLEILKMAKMYLDAAKAKVEFCHEANQGMSLYNYAVKLMKKINCKSC
jgi:hypothetical protein